MLGSVSRKITALGVAISLCSGPAFASPSSAAVGHPPNSVLMSGLRCVKQPVVGPPY